MAAGNWGISVTQFHPLTAADIGRTSSWLAADGTFEWLDFSREAIHPIALRALLDRNTHRVSLFSDPGSAGGAPLGVVGISGLTRGRSSGYLWVIHGERAPGTPGRATQVQYDFLRTAFADGVESVSTWAVEANAASFRMAWRLGMRYMGRQRACHVLRGQRFDRIWWDLLPSELVYRTDDPAPETVEAKLYARARDLQQALRSNCEIRP